MRPCGVGRWISDFALPVNFWVYSGLMSLTRRTALALPLVALVPFVPVLAEANVPEAVMLGSDPVMITTMFVVEPGDWGDGGDELGGPG